MAAVRETVFDSTWVFRARFNGGQGPFRSSERGLRGGKLKYRFHLKKTVVRFAFRKLAYVPRVRLSGKVKLSLSTGEHSGRVRVRGRKAARGKLRFKPNGNVVGRLNGKQVRYRARR